jgi:large subunit ribosomal protein L3
MIGKRIKPGLLGRKIGMTQIYTGEGACKGVTVIELGPCIVTQIKSKDKEGYEAIQLGFGPTELRRLDKARQGHFEKKKLKPYRHLQEFRVPTAAQFQLGQALTVDAFAVGDLVDVTGISKGKGFQGVIKRHHKGGGPASHGSTFHRSTGSIGQRTWPGRVFKLMKLPGHMGSRQVTVRNLKVLQVVTEKNYLVLEGAVPGGENALVAVKTARTEEFLKRVAPKQAAQPAAEEAAKVESN